MLVEKKSGLCRQLDFEYHAYILQTICLMLPMGCPGHSSVATDRQHGNTERVHTHATVCTRCSGPNPPPSTSQPLVLPSVPSLTSRYHRLTPHLFRYTSACSAWEAPLDARRGPYMMVAPPHGVLPVGNIITMLSFPMLWGFHLKGLTTDAALR